MLRNFVIVKGYPGTAGMLHELLRRAREERPLSPFYEHPACGFRWHGRDGMDIPMRDGQPVCPRCELRRLADAIERVRAFAAHLDDIARSMAGPEAVHPVAAHIRHQLNATADEAQQTEQSNCPTP
ncbi:hypothetical protein [Streptomyces sp. KL116D]|uniref:hypothetical protein n=1 Tax=Streptomyces sp. KL116D TaxID=3045152 RepID=UPI003555C1C1